MKFFSKVSLRLAVTVLLFSSALAAGGVLLFSECTLSLVARCALAAAESGKYEEALFLSEFCAKYDRSLDVAALAVQTAFQKPLAKALECGQYDTACKIASEWTEYRKGCDALPFYWLGCCYERKGDYEHARESFLLALSVHEDYPAQQTMAISPILVALATGLTTTDTEEFESPVHTFLNDIEAAASNRAVNLRESRRIAIRD